jgi:hypothetical protein
MVEKDIGKITKGEYQGTVTEIVVGVREYNGKVGVDIREFVQSEKYTGPTKKGLRIPAESFAQFKEMINSVQDADLVASEQPSAGAGETAPAPGQETLKEEAKEDLPDY